MKQCWSGSELAQFWSLSNDEKQLSDQRIQQGRLGLAVLLKFFQLEGRFPRYHKEVPSPAVDHLAEQLEVSASAWLDYPLKGRSVSRDHEQLPLCTFTPFYLPGFLSESGHGTFSIKTRNTTVRAGSKSSSSER